MPGAVLLIGDALAEQRVLAKLLEGAGCEVHCAPGGEGGLRKACECKPDLILLDGAGMDSVTLETCRRLKADPELQEVPILCVTASREAEDRLSLLQAGAADYLIRPYLDEEVLGRVRTHLELGRSKVRLAALAQERTEVLRETRETLEVALFHSPSGVLIADAPDAVLRFANPAALEILGTWLAERLGDSLYSTDIGGQARRSDGTPLAPGAVARKILDGQMIHGEELIVRDRNGQDRWININGAPIRDAKGRITAGIAIFQDVTEAKRATQVLATERQLLMDIVEALPDPTFVVDADKCVIAWNRAVEALTGVKKETVLGQGNYAYALPLYGERRPILLDLLDVPQEEIERSYTYVRRIGDRLYAEAFLPRLNDGRGAHLWGVAAPLFDQTGRRIGALEVIRDVTERKKAEEALRESERKVRAIFDLSFGFIGLLSPEGILLETNQTALDFEGVTAEQVLGRPFWECPWWTHDPEAQQRLQAAIQRARAGELVRYEATHRALDGSLHTIDFTLKPVRDDAGQVVMLIPEGRDITDRKQMEEALRLSLLQLRANLENTPNVAIQWYDEDGKILFWNPASESMYGWKSEEVVGKTLASFAYSAEDAAETHRILLEVLATGRTFGPEELRIRRRDGTFCWVLSTTFTMPLGSGRTGGVSMDVDITERKQAEEAREQLNLQLLQAQKMEVVGRLAGGVAHDFNNMLGVILGRADLALNLVQPGDPIRSSLLEILKAARHSAELTRQLLAFARKQAVEPHVLNLNDTVGGMLKMLRRLIGENIELVWKPGTELWPIRMDPSQIDQILANLCVNARDALQTKGSITIQTENVILDERFCSTHYGAVPGAFIVISVCDTGCGMAPDVLQHIFEPFFTTKPSGQGTGLGLATVYGIVQQNAGYIEVDSEPGRGTCFRVHLPRTEAMVEAAAPEPAAQAVRGHGETLLLAEDDEWLRNLSREALVSLGYGVLAAGSAQEALRMAEASPVEIRLLITDVVMPGMNGRELVEHVRIRKPDLKCLYISGHAPDYIQAQGVLPQGAAFLRKPYSLQELATKVREVLGQA